MSINTARQYAPRVILGGVGAARRRPDARPFRVPLASAAFRAKTPGNPGVGVTLEVDLLHAAAARPLEPVVVRRFTSIRARRPGRSHARDGRHRRHDRPLRDPPTKSAPTSGREVQPGDRVRCRRHHQLGGARGAHNRATNGYKRRTIWRGRRDLGDLLFANDCSGVFRARLLRGSGALRIPDPAHDLKKTTATTPAVSIARTLQYVAMA